MKKIIFMLVIIALHSCNSKPSTAPDKKQKWVKGGEVLHTGYFDVTINSFTISSKVKTDNPYTGLKAGANEYFMIINSTFKNMDTESRMITDGVLYIKTADKTYTFDKAEMVMADGYSLKLDQINPLTSFTTNLVYRLPDEITGQVYYQPGRATAEEFIFITNLPVADASAKTWNPIYTFSGEGSLSSAAFKLSGHPVKIECKNTGAVYCIPKGTDWSNARPEKIEANSETLVTKAEGNYYLHVTGAGRWKVIVSE